MNKNPTSTVTRTEWLDEQTQSPIIDQHARKLTTFLEALADGLCQRFERERDFAMTLADHLAAMMNIEDGIANFKFQSEVESLAGAEQAVIAAQLHAAKTPVFNRKCMAVNNNNATISSPARMAAAC